MKKYSLIVVLFLMFTFQFCESTTDTIPYSYSKTVIDDINDYQFPEGNYYSYKFSSYNENMEPVEEIERLRNKNIIVDQVWYRSPQNGCTPPGSTLTTRTMYSAVLLMKLQNSNDQLIDEKYSKVNYKPSISCGYNVDSYKLKK